MTTQRCFIYTCSRKPDTYVYLSDEGGIDVLAPELLASLGRLDLLMSIELTPERKLARADARVVIETLQSRGYYLQLPPATPLPGEA